MKVLICDYTGNSAQWIDEFIIKENVEIVGTITPATDKNLLAEKSSWEYLLIFEQGNKKFFMSLAHFMNIPPQRVIFALDWNSWAAHPAAMYTLLNPQGGGQLAYRILHFKTARQFNYFTSCTTADGLHYVATSKDNYVIRPMYLNNKNHAEHEMKLFQLLTKIFYGIDGSEGLFLDLGANIGTTGIYFTKILAPNLKLLAFEPDPENFKLLRANLILNDMEEKTIAENYGLGDVENEMTMYRDIYNPGHNGIFSNDSGVEAETVKIIPLDKYFAEKNIS
ncbi:MAG: FkbM family methyltransferase, partial [Selenomonadaceae bacterium]|nr:FkbM family methyltransferase [Selenomonadaceae bacterium]